MIKILYEISHYSFLDTIRSRIVVKFSIARIRGITSNLLRDISPPTTQGLAYRREWTWRLACQIASHFPLNFSAVLGYDIDGISADTMMTISRWSPVGAWRKASDGDYNLYWYVWLSKKKRGRVIHIALRSKMKI